MYTIRKEVIMLSLALTFLVIGLIAGVLGIAGIAVIATKIAWVLFLIGVVFLIVHMVRGRAPVV
jgi:uncharacterized membrane protein YtjA (UPF0391 family)